MPRQRLPLPPPFDFKLPPLAILSLCLVALVLEVVGSWLGFSLLRSSTGTVYPSTNESCRGDLCAKEKLAKTKVDGEATLGSVVIAAASGPVLSSTTDNAILEMPVGIKTCTKVAAVLKIPMYGWNIFKSTF